MGDADLQGKVQGLRDFSGQPFLPFEQAVKLLKASNNSVELALNRLFDDNNGTAFQEERWDDSAFHADRYGEDNGMDGMPSFRIDYAPGVDNYPHSTAPSRPPSRTSHHSGASVGQSGDVRQSIETAQESGVIGSSGRPVFGPATKDYYDASQWALVPTTTSAEYIPDPTANDRKRDVDGPAFIRPSPNGDYLPALLPILHSIPLFRNALLAPNVVAESYDVGDEWWKGNAPPPSRTIDYESNVEAAEDLDILHETQRLMAFLDSTDRAYGSVEHLLRLEAFTKFDATIKTDLLRFLMRWSNAYLKHHPEIDINGSLRSKFDLSGSSQESFVLDASVVRTDPNTQTTLYDVVDDALFPSPAESAHIVDISNVLIFKLQSHSLSATPLNCKIPPTFYADRYLEKNKEAIESMFSEMKQHEQHITDIDANINRLKFRTTKKGDKVESLQLLKSSMVAFEPRADDLVPDPRDETVLKQLELVYDSIDRKLKALEDQKIEARETLIRISDLFKGPIDNTSATDTETVADDEVASLPIEKRPAPIHSYKLCGVSTRPSVFYILHPDIKSDVPDATQWWRIDYQTVDSEAYIFRERCSLAQVLEKASSEHDKALLVYANEAALSTPSLPLTEALHNFVKYDNLKFLQELQNENPIGYDDNFEDNANRKRFGEWDNDAQPLPTYADDWAHYGGTTVFGNQFESMSAKQFHEQQADEGLSSTTLTPNTEIEDTGNGVQMEEANGGKAMWDRKASSDTIGGEAMDLIHSQSTVDLKDIEMHDVDSSAGLNSDMTMVDHIETLDEDVNKGG